MTSIRMDFDYAKESYPPRARNVDEVVRRAARFGLEPHVDHRNLRADAAHRLKAEATGNMLSLPRHRYAGEFCVWIAVRTSQISHSRHENPPVKTRALT